MDELLEKLADLEHRQWEKWAKAIISEVAPQRRSRWKKYFVPYEKLDEKSKDLDREWAKKVMRIVNEHYENISKDSPQPKSEKD